MTTPSYISQRQFLVTLSADSGFTQIPDNWMTKSGGNVTADSVKVYPGGSKDPVILTGIPEHDNITVSRAYDTTVDGEMLKTLREEVGSWRGSMTIVETNPDWVAINKTTYPVCVLVGINVPEYESTSSDPATIQLEFAVTKGTGPGKA